MLFQRRNFVKKMRNAVTTQLLAGTRASETRSTRNLKFRDDRLLAFVAISPNGVGPFFPFDAFSDITKPILFVSGDNDKGRNGEMSEWRRDAYDGANAGEKYLAWISGTHHNFGGIAGSPPRMRKLLDRRGEEIPRYVELVATSTLVFWDAFLKGDDAAKKQLSGDSLGSISENEMTWEHK